MVENNTFGLSTRKISFGRIFQSSVGNKLFGPIKSNSVIGSMFNPKHDAVIINENKSLRSIIRLE